MEDPKPSQNNDDKFGSESIDSNLSNQRNIFPAAQVAALMGLGFQRNMQLLNNNLRNIVIPDRRKVIEIEYKAPSSFLSIAKKYFGEIHTYKTPIGGYCEVCNSSLNDHSPSVRECQKVSKRFRPVKLPCGHIFHRKCIIDAIKSASDGSNCPSCKSLIIRDPQGKCPSGTMEIFHSKKIHCSDYKNNPISVGTIIIKYHVPKSKQLSYHDNPDVFQQGTVRECYLPNLGRQSSKLLLRLEYAFVHGLVFTVDRNNKVAWTSIPHKLSIDEDFIESKYFDICDEELDKLRVPKAESLYLRQSEALPSFEDTYSNNSIEEVSR